MDHLGVVIIGRNEGERLRRCFKSLPETIAHIVYVDSGSTDESVQLAEQHGIEVVALDMAIPFTAARGRNVGFDRLLQIAPAVEFVQFIDGDCELMHGWLEVALSFLHIHSLYAIVCGRLRERYPEASVYNQLCDLEWAAPSGDVKACGGIFMIRSVSFSEVGGMNIDIVGGEEPEMCFRLRQQGWKIRRESNDMAWHDAAMTTFSQWWKRAMRSGFAYAEGFSLHGLGQEHYRLRECLRILLWGFVIPFLIIVASVFYSQLCILFLLIYFVQFVKVFFVSLKKNKSSRIAAFTAFFIVIDKFPQVIGLFMFLKKVFSVNSRGSEGSVK